MTPSLSAPGRFFDDSLVWLRSLLDEQRDELDQAVSWCTDAIAADGIGHLFGFGHNRKLCEEMTPRQGCFAGWHTIVELVLSLEQLKHFDAQYARRIAPRLWTARVTR